MKSNKRTALYLSFLVPAVIMLALFIIRGIYPFGDKSFLNADLYHQYMPFFSEFMNKVKAGEGLAYSYNVGIGSNFMALYVYYLASPLHWLAFLVPQEYLIEFISYLVIIKTGLCGVTAAYYLQKRFGTKDLGIVLFSCFYALSGFMAAYNYNIMWLDCVVLLPLIVLGLERLVKEGKCGLYCVTLALSIFTNYYISIMICIFLVLYFFVLLLTEKRSLRIIGNFALYSLLAGGMAAVLLVPEVCAIIVTDFGDMNFPKKLESYFSVLDMLSRHCICVSTENGLQHWPNIYCGVAVFLLMPMYVLNGRIPIRKRFANTALVGFILLSFSTNMLDFIWHGMNYPDSLPARQSFIYIFLILVMCYEAYRYLRESPAQHILHFYLGAVGFLLFCEKFAETEHFATGVEMLSILFVTIYAVLFYLYCTRQGTGWKRGLAIAAFVAVAAESSINMGYSGIGVVSRSEYLAAQADYKALYEYTLERENDFYRLEKFSRKTKNDGTLTGYPTASVFSSTMNSYVMDMYERLGMRHSKVYYCFDGATAFTAALLNVKYMFAESEKYENSLYRLLEKSGDVYLYESTQSLPFGYVAPVGFDLPLEDENNGIQIQNQMINELGVTGKLFTKVAGDSTGSDVVFDAKEDGIYYAELAASGTAKVEAIGGPMETQKFQDLKKDCILYLGHMYEGDTITLTNANEEDATPNVSAEIYLLNEEVLQEAMQKLSAQHLTEVSYDSTHLNGALKLTEPGRLILSIPYEAGWTVTLNGKAVEPQLFGGTLMAFDLQPGEYKLEMHYVPAGSLAGAVVSTVSVALFVLLEWLKRRNIAGKKIKEEGMRDG